MVFDRFSQTRPSDERFLDGRGGRATASLWCVHRPSVISLGYLALIAIHFGVLLALLDHVVQGVEPVVEQVKGLTQSIPVQVPEQLNKAVEVGRAPRL